MCRACRLRPHDTEPHVGRPRVDDERYQEQLGDGDGQPKPHPHHRGWRAQPNPGQLRTDVGKGAEGTWNLLHQRRHLHNSQPPREGRNRPRLARGRVTHPRPPQTVGGRPARHSIHNKYVGGAEEVGSSAASNNQQHARSFCQLHAPEGQRLPA